ncbi:hypothetical protein AVL50_19745 [Flammeovirga sp. SJP92]|nr:hypothetical protein AVL50_19745 [Flammeovirga sp. SJP92]
MGTSISIAVVLIVGILFVNFSPQFGGSHSEEAIARFNASKNFKEGQFWNLEFTQTTPSLSDLPKLFKELSREASGLTPSKGLPVQSVKLNEASKQTRVIWFGHSAFLLEIAGKRLLIDPMLSDVPSPHPWLGSERFTKELPIAIEDLPKIDAVLISHDHYDHLDYETILKIKDKVGKYFTPLGVGTHLQAWGVPKEDITELDWWHEVQFDNLTFAATPARHFSGRGLTDAQKTLWASWVIKSDSENIFFSGDSGYGQHFKEIGNKYGPFDLALMECGQYNDHLTEFAIHMLPEETAQASVDVKAKVMMPVHWASFSLNRHNWKEPVERLVAKAGEMDLQVVTPIIGQVIEFNNLDSNITSWWADYE